MKKLYIVGAFACLITACKPSVNITTQPTAGDANFTNYLAIGNSLTAGYADNSLYVSGQLNSYPQRLYEQFSLVPRTGGGATSNFIQPLLVGNEGYPGPKKILGMTYTTCDSTDSTLGPVDYPNYIMEVRDAQTFTSSVNNGQINNIGVPGIRVADYLVPGYPSLNPYAKRFYHSLTGTPMDELAYRVHNLAPTFFTLWLGANDVLGYALGGGQGDGSMHASPQAGNYYSPQDISNVDEFFKDYDSIVNLSISTGALGALINIPNIDSLPFFTAIPINGLQLTRQSQVDSMQALYRNYGWDKVFQLGSNYFIIEEHDHTIRQAVPGERLLLTLPIENIRCHGWGSTTPIPAQYVLTTTELQNIRQAISKFNGYIQQKAQLHNLAYVDMNKFMGQIAGGYSYNGIKYTTQFVSGGAFSLDGIHPNPRGYALIANEIIRTINNQYHSSIPPIDVNKYHGVDFP